MTEKLCGRTPGIGLSQLGRQQAIALAEGLSSIELNQVYSSPLERAMETAFEIARRHKLLLRTDERLLELDFGEWTGMSFDELRDDPLWQQYNETRETAWPPGGEQPLSARDRAESAVEEIAARHCGQTIAIVTHSDIIRSLLTGYLSMSLNHLLRFDIQPASVTEVVVGGAYPVVCYSNRTYV